MFLPSPMLPLVASKKNHQNGSGKTTKHNSSAPVRKKRF
jgi:hypothetical protein